MNTNPSQLLARIVKDAARLREESFDETEASRRRALQYVNFTSCYQLSMSHAAAAACAKVGHHDLTLPVLCLLQSNWNEALDWADSVLEFQPKG